MADARIRQKIAFLAAQMMYERTESEYFTAKRKAARRLGVDYRYRPKDLPSNREIRDQIQVMARIHEGDKRKENLRAMRLEALRLMHKLYRHHPHLIGSVVTGHIRKGSDIDLHIFSNSISSVTSDLEDHGARFDVEHKRVIKQGEERVFVHIHVYDRFTFELTVYPEDKINYPFRSSITGKVIRRASIEDLEKMLQDEKPDVPLEEDLDRLEEHVDRFELFRFLLAPLEDVKQSRVHHPEGDALYHSLQVFELARYERPYDEEFILAALLHDVGKAIDPADHVSAGLRALEGSITERTAFLIAHHMDAQKYNEGGLSKRKRRRLEGHEDFDDLMLLRELDDRGRVPGADVSELSEALDFIRELADLNSA